MTCAAGSETATSEATAVPCPTPSSDDAVAVVVDPVPEVLRIGVAVDRVVARRAAGGERLMAEVEAAVEDGHPHAAPARARGWRDARRREGRLRPHLREVESSRKTGICDCLPPYSALPKTKFSCTARTSG